VVVFQIVIIVFLPVAYWSLSRVDAEVPRLLPVIFLASWLGEATSIALYDFYQYDPAWWWRVGGVPLLVPLIWPAVILSGRAVVRALWPNLGRAEPLAVAVIVFFDAAMVEVAAVACGLWSWAEPGYLGVPLVGVVGWAIFAAAVATLLPKLPGLRRWLVVLLAPAVLHLALVPAWWVFFKWVWRGDWFGLFLAVVATLTALAIFTRGTRRMSMQIAWSRLLAAGIFVGLVLVANDGGWPVWRHVLLTSIPYVLVTDFQK
jgi:hypothetical protein